MVISSDFRMQTTKEKGIFSRPIQIFILWVALKKADYYKT